MLVEIAIADSYGAAREYVPQSDTINDGKTYCDNPVYTALKKGKYTDDTQMSIAVAIWLLNGNLTREELANCFVETFHRDPRKGYARGFQLFLEATLTGEEFLKNIQPTSEKSGAAMRAGVIGLATDISEVMQLAELQAKLTHDTPGGIFSAQAAALIVHHQFWKLGDLNDLPQFLSQYLPEIPWDQEWQGETGDLGVSIVRAAVSVLGRAKSLTDVLILSVAQGGDTDTLAAIAMAAACVSNLPNDFTPELYSGLENGRYGIEYLKRIDGLLAKKPKLEGTFDLNKL